MPRSNATRTGDFDWTLPPITTGTGKPPPFDLNAPPRTGQGAYGAVPGAIGLPPVYNDVAGVFPGLSGNLDALSKNISSELAGDLDPQTVAMLQNTAAQFGIGQGTPLSPFAGAQGLRHLGLTAEAQKAKGIEHLLASLPTLAKTLTVSPETQLDVANRNATLNAAPDPQAAAKEAQRLFQQYMAMMQRSGGGGVSYSPGGGGGGGGVKNLNTPNYAYTPWADFQPTSVGGTRPTDYYAGTGINWGTQGPAPRDLWAPQGPELGQWGGQGPELGLWGNGAGGGDMNNADYFSDWLWGGSDYPGAPGQQPDYPDWDY